MFALADTASSMFPTPPLLAPALEYSRVLLWRLTDAANEQCNIFIGSLNKLNIFKMNLITSFFLFFFYFLLANSRPLPADDEKPRGSDLCHSIYFCDFFFSSEKPVASVNFKLLIKAA